MESLKKQVLLMLFASSVLFISEGCTQRLIDYTMISSKNVDVSGVKQGDRQSGEDCVYHILFIPLGQPDMKNAIDRVLEKGKGDILIDIVFSTKSWTAILFGESCYIVEGTVSQTASYAR